ncbi:MAG: REP-associated tyrosine transposase [Candidatus Acidiferrales bacterium]
MPKGLKRCYGKGHLHFLTFSCYRRLPLLGTARARNTFVTALAKIRERYHFLLVGYVVMPEHVHLLISEGRKCTPSLVLRVLKQRVSRDLRKRGRRAAAGQMRLAFRDGDMGLPRFWQPRFYDFNVYSAKKIREKLEYMHANPVKRGLVANPGEWIWSSFLSYEKGEAGLVPIDFAD